ncbi:MAG: hypothetical protein PWQ27_1486 [Kosmotoga sp.]|nr:hypothetical protein [Kosmotoga sp.]MDK2954103.1 hypothetical protein [Kosmotoga sp.]
MYNKFVLAEPNGGDKVAEYQVAIIYGRLAGVEDFRAIKDYFEKGFSTKFIFFVSREPVGAATEFIKELLYCDVKVVENPRKEAKKLFKKLKASGQKVFIIASDEFGYRGMSGDPV